MATLVDDGLLTVRLAISLHESRIANNRFSRSRTLWLINGEAFLWWLQVLRGKLTEGELGNLRELRGTPAAPVLQQKSASSTAIGSLLMTTPAQSTPIDYERCGWIAKSSSREDQETHPYDLIDCFRSLMEQIDEDGTFWHDKPCLHRIYELIVDVIQFIY